MARLRLLFGSALLLFSFSGFSAESGGSSGHHFEVHLRGGMVQYQGQRIFRKYCDEILDKGKVYGESLWPRMQFVFNPNSSVVFGIGLGLVNYTGKASRKYQGSEEISVKTNGSIFENGFTVGFKPGISWMQIVGEVGFGLPMTESVTIKSPLKTKTVKDNQRELSNLVSLGANAHLWRIVVEGLVTLSVLESDDYLYSLGAGFAF